MRPFAVAHVREYFRGMILLAGNVVGEARVGLGREEFARNTEFAAQTVAEFGQKFSRKRTERQQLDVVHRADAASRFQPYFLSLL